MNIKASNKNSVKRDIAFDILKFFAIYLVIWGHCIQYYSAGDYWDKPMYRFIYSFHMPLFMCISGFFASNIGKRSFGKMIIKRSSQLLLPLAIFVALLCFTGGIDNYISRFIHGLKHYLWFLRSLFVCTILWWTVSSRRKHKFLILMLTLSLALLEPYIHNGRFCLLFTNIPEFNLSKMYPCFIFGAILYQYYDWIEKYAKVLLITSGALFIVMNIFWDETFWSLAAKFPQDWHFWYRIIIGLAGSLFFILLTKTITPQLQKAFPRAFNFAIKNGKETLGIYICQTYLVELYLPGYSILHMDNMDFFTFNMLWTPFFALILLMACILIVKILQSTPLSAFLFLGKELNFSTSGATSKL